MNNIQLVSELDVTILMPCLNEVKSLSYCIAAARDALNILAEKGFSGEILISDNGSDDGSQALAEQNDCRVVYCPQRGYGAALIYGCQHARGRFVVIGDADASYDFREAVAIVEKLQSGYDLCMGNRFKGKILPGAMPWKNKYIGNPALSGILNLFYRSGIGDAHCGIRGFTREAFHRMRLTTYGMEFASEMVVKAALLKLKCTEVPVTLHCDRRGRKPHLQPWRDGWRHLRFLLMMSPMWAYFLPSAFLLLVSSFIAIGLLLTPPGGMLAFGPLKFGDHWMILAGGLFSSSISGVMLGLASLFYTLHQEYRPVTPFYNRLTRLFTIERILMAGLGFLLLGLSVLTYIVVIWSRYGFGHSTRIREMVISTALVGTGLKLMFWGLLISLITVPVPVPDKINSGT